MKFITINKFCEAYQLSRSTAYRLHARGDLPFAHIGRAVRIRLVDAEAWAASLNRPDNDA
jgi:excisionase family DNA binding protein